MGRLLVIDDSVNPEYFKDFLPLFNEDDVHHIIYLDNMPAMERGLLKDTTTQRFLEKFKLASSCLYSHEDLVKYLKEHEKEFDRIILDGLEGKCIHVIRDVPLSLDKTEVVTGSLGVMELCKEKQIPYRDRNNLY